MAAEASKTARKKISNLFMIYFGRMGMGKKNVLILFGGKSAEHEVSIITGLQVLENIDREKYNPLAIYLNKKNTMYFLPGLKSRQGFFKVKREKVVLANEGKGPYIKSGSFIKKKIFIDAAYLTFHGGTGEDGSIQGMFNVLDTPYTSPGVESSAVSMNKFITKLLVKKKGVPVLAGKSVYRWDLKSKKEKCVLVEETKKKLGFPLILKPAHLGSSIGIEIIKNETQLKKQLNAASFIDEEILLEKYLPDFEEFNCSAIKVDTKIELSEIERPIKEDELLSFADKYSKGGGKKTKGGMAGLVRELPAKIDKKLEEKIKNLTRSVYKTLRCTGLVRIDFMVDKKTDKIYFTEINTIPGSMSFYLWEAKGLTFEEQITRSIEEAVKRQEFRNKLNLEYETDIVEKFVSNASQ